MCKELFKRKQSRLRVDYSDKLEKYPIYDIGESPYIITHQDLATLLDIKENTFRTALVNYQPRTFYSYFLWNNGTWRIYIGQFNLTPDMYTNSFVGITVDNIDELINKFPWTDDQRNMLEDVKYALNSKK